MNNTIMCCHNSPVPWLHHLKQWIGAFCAQDLADFSVVFPSGQAVLQHAGESEVHLYSGNILDAWHESRLLRHICGRKCWCLGHHWHCTTLLSNLFLPSELLHLIYARPSWDNPHCSFCLWPCLEMWIDFLVKYIDIWSFLRGVLAGLRERGG